MKVHRPKPLFYKRGFDEGKGLVILSFGGGTETKSSGASAKLCRQQKKNTNDLHLVGCELRSMWAQL